MRFASLLAIGFLVAAPVSAQDFTVFGGAALSYDIQLDKAAGGDNAISFEPYIEAEFNHVYGGVSLSLGQDAVDQEVDLYLGYRNESATGMTYDLAYTRFLLPNDGGNCCGEFSVSLGAPVGEKLELNINGTFDPEASDGTVSIGAGYELGEKLSVAAAVGMADFNGAQEWELGAAYQLTDETALDVHYYDGSDYTGYVTLMVSFDTTLFSR